MSYASIKSRPIIYRPQEQAKQGKHNNKRSKIQVSLHQPFIVRTIKLNNQVSREREKSQMNKNSLYAISQHKIKSQADIKCSQSHINIDVFPKYVQKQIEKPQIHIATIKNNVKHPFQQLQKNDKMKTNSFYQFLTKVKPDVEKPKSSYKFYTNCTIPATISPEFVQPIQNNKITKTQPIQGLFERKVSIDIKNQGVSNILAMQDKIIFKSEVNFPTRNKFISVTDRNVKNTTAQISDNIPKHRFSNQLTIKNNPHRIKESFSKKWEDKLNNFAKSKEHWMTNEKIKEQQVPDYKDNKNPPNSRVQRFNSHYNRYEQVVNRPNIISHTIPSITLKTLPNMHNTQDIDTSPERNHTLSEASRTNYFINLMPDDQKAKTPNKQGFQRNISLNRNIIDDYTSDKSITDSKPTQARANQSPQKDFFPEADLRDSIYLQSPVKPYQKLLYQLANEKQNLFLKTLQQQIVKGQYLGMGRFSSAYTCSLKCTNFLFVLKEIYKFTIKINNLENQLLREIQIQAQINHPNIISLYYAFSSDSKYCIALQYGQTTLLKLLEQQKIIPQQICIQYLRQIIEGLLYLHSQQIIHRDIKPENIILVNNVCKIADFGWSVKKNDMTGSICGTPGYASPQIMNLNQYSYKTDCWSLGMLAYEIAYGKLEINEFSQFSHPELMKKVQQNAQISSNYKDFIKKLLIIRENDRMQISQAKNHKLFSKQQPRFIFE